MIQKLNIDFTLPLFNTLSPLSKDLLSKMLNKDPKKRYDIQEC